MNRLADFVLMYQQNIEQAIEEKRLDACTQKTGGGSSNHAFISDPTCQRALRNILPVGTVQVPYGPKIAGKCDVKTLRNPEKWLEVVEITWERFSGTPANEIMELRYHKNNTNMLFVAKKLHISMQRCYVLLDNVHRFLIDYAKEYGAYEVKTKYVDRLGEILEKLEEKENVVTKEIKQEEEQIDIITSK